MSAILINNNEFLTARSNKPTDTNRLVFDFEGNNDRKNGTSNKHRLVRKIRENEDFSSSSDEGNASVSKLDEYFRNGNDSLNESFGSFNELNVQHTHLISHREAEIFKASPSFNN